MDGISLLIAILILAMALLATAQSAIAVKVYYDTKKAHDTNFNFSAVMLSLGLLVTVGTIVYIYQGLKAPGVSQAPSTVAGSATPAQTTALGEVTSLEKQLEQVANLRGRQAANAAAAAKAAQALRAPLIDLSQGSK
ncbi:hypothetical protein AR679_gp054 [Yellowstone lake phycodnavirus 1]|uniref:hypothetical protein n=1 Tax=Yellowstone lake phycodnavirus 1 TaxID=1586713 RepID=UPI0006EB5C6D|nr:hypothetical protein AR679_gp054 [Yellowstone lake phycodnavirus 1]BAT22080.1 hypothetical protein [Yellowstone lake phycodnavirus 1]